MASKLKSYAGEKPDPTPACRSRFIDVGGMALHVRVWPGDPARTIVIWHGITGTGLDHVELAERLSAHGFRVIAPDSIGCGISDWAADQATGYGLAALAEAAVSMLDQLVLDRVSWLGLSKGGGLGIRLAAEMPERIAALVLCDVGPGLSAAFRGALAKRIASPPRFKTIAALRAQVARMLVRNGVDADGDLTDRLAAAWARRLDDGGVGYHYDPALSQQFLNCPEDFDLWRFWDRIECRALILRGEHSDVLPEAELQAMLQRNGGASSQVLAGSGHINFLDDPRHQDALIAFLDAAT